MDADLWCPAGYQDWCDVQPRCNVQLQPDSQTLPDKICYEMARMTTQDFASQKMAFITAHNYAYAASWPLPIGAKTIEEWYSKRCGQMWSDQSFELAGKHVLGVAMQIPQPLCEDEDAKLGLAVKRRLYHGQTRASVIWLLGLVSKVEEGIYRFTDAITQVESHAKSASEEHELMVMARGLRQWYEKHILGLAIRPGRPVGTGTFTPEAFVKVAKEAIRAIREGGLYPSQSRVAEFFSRSPGLPKCDDRQIRKWLRETPYKSWEDLLEDI